MNWEKNQIVSVAITPKLHVVARIKRIYPKKQEADIEILDLGISKQLGTNFQRVGVSQLLSHDIKYNIEQNKRQLFTKVDGVNDVNHKNRMLVKRVKPAYFPSLYLKQFSNWFDSTFFQYRDPQSNKNKQPNERITLKYFQRLIRDYIASPGSPYRGTLIYHDMGVGKTCTAIAVAEALKLERNVIVMLPASLKIGFQRQIREDCGDIAYLNDIHLMNQTYKFISYNAPNTIAQLNAIGSLDNHTIIIDEVHNLISIMLNPTSIKGPIIYHKLFAATNVKIIALSGTPVIQNPFEIALLMNLLRGSLITVNFKVEGGTSGQKKTDDGWLEVLQESFINNPNWIHLNLSPTQIRVVYSGPYPDPTSPHFQEAVNEFVEKAYNAGIVVKYIGIVGTTQERGGAPIVGTSLFPDNEKLFASLYLEQKIVSLEDLDLPFRVDISQKKKKTAETIYVNLIKDPATFMRRIQGLISFYPGGGENFPELARIEFVTVPMSNYQFQQYSIVRNIERGREQQRTIKIAQLKIPQGMSKKDRLYAEKDISASLFRTLSRQFSNFVFPPNIHRPFTAYWKNVLEKLLYADDDTDEQKNIDNVESTQKNIVAYFEQIQNALNELITDTAQPLHKTKLGEYSPKMLAILNNLETSPGSAIIYSFYKTLEGVGIFAKVLEANGWKRIILPQSSIIGSKDPFAVTKTIVDNFWRNINKNGNSNKPGHVYASWTGESTDEERRVINMIFNDSRNKRGAYIRALLITKAAAEGINLKNVRRVYILDPHWNETLMEQVIGRSRRMGSHLDLPAKDRNVEVYRYLSTFTKEQRDKHPDTLSTDEYLIQLAMSKHQTVKQLLQVLRRAAFDCNLWSARFIERGIVPEKCFHLPGSTGMHYLPNWEEDLGYGKIVKQVKKTTEIWKQVLMDGNRQLYLLDLKNKKLIRMGSQNTPHKKLDEIPKPHKKLIAEISRGDVALPILRAGDPPVLIGKVDQVTGQLIPTVAL